MYPLGLNLFFQPGLGPGFFLILGSSGTFWLFLLLLETVALRALGGCQRGSIKHLGFCQLTFICLTHLVSVYGSNNSSSDTPSFLLSSKSSSEMTLHTHKFLKMLWSQKKTPNSTSMNLLLLHIGSSVNKDRGDRPFRHIAVSSSIFQLDRSRRLLVTCII